MPAKKSAKKKKPAAVPVTPASDWRTTDQDEIQRRVQRAIDEKHSVTNLYPEHSVFSNFAVKSPSGMNYQVEIRDLKDRVFSCTCLDFRTAGLGTCKHTESTVMWLKRRHKSEFRAAEITGSSRMDLVPVGDTLGIERNLSKLPPSLRPLFDLSGRILDESAESLTKLNRCPRIRISQDVEGFLESRRRAEERVTLRRDYETGVVEGRHPEHVTLCPLYPYQREGMLHLAFAERSAVFHHRQLRAGGHRQSRHQRPPPA